MRTLVLGPIPSGATPQTHVASGPWCFVGQEESFPGWDGEIRAGAEASAQSFPMPEDPYPDAESMYAAGQAANGEVLRLVALLGGQKNVENNASLSAEFWQMALGPFLLLCVHMLAERQKRMCDLVECYGSEPLRVELLPADSAFSFQTTLDFMLHGVQDQIFNQYVFSRLAEALAPPAWELVYLPAKPLHQAKADPPQSFPAKCKGRIRNVLRDLPFPRYKGFALWQALALSLAVVGNKRRQADASLDFSLYCAQPLAWRFPAEELITACLPKDLWSKPLPSLRSGNTHGPVRGMSPAFSQDDRYRLELAAWRASGGRLFCVQHGANYGNLRCPGILPFEYSQHAFFSWGWQEHQGVPGNIHPMPHPALAALCNKHKEAAPRLILVGTEMSTYTYRLKSRPLAKAMLSYRAGKVTFLRTVLDGLENRGNDQGAAMEGAAPEILYRPYFKVAGGLDDAAHVQRHLPQAGICTGDLTSHILQCRLLVLDHYGTTLHTALAANVPTVAFWDRKAWGMEANTEPVLDVLQAAGILHATAESAARHVLSVWDSVDEWWQSPTVQQARSLWVERYARVGDTANRPWTPWEMTRHWFTALRNM